MDDECFMLTNLGEKVFVDPDIKEKYAGVTWWAMSNGCGNRYATTRLDRKKFSLLHRLVLGIEDTKVDIDHINGNGLDNRRENLRVCSRSQNMGNCKKHADGSSRFKGVCWNKNRNKWYARICLNYKPYPLGSYLNEEDAARAYNKAAIEKFGEFARINEIPEVAK